MAHQLIQILRSENIEFVVAPYEADAQLAYLSSLEAEKGGIVAVITEDSDLIVYGSQAMDRYGNGDELLLDKVFDSVTGTPSFRSFDTELFIGIGIAKAYSMVSKYRNIDHKKANFIQRQPSPATHQKQEREHPKQRHKRAATGATKQPQSLNFDTSRTPEENTPKQQTPTTRESHGRKYSSPQKHKQNTPEKLNRKNKTTDKTLGRAAAKAPRPQRRLPENDTAQPNEYSMSQYLLLPLSHS